MTSLLQDGPHAGAQEVEAYALVGSSVGPEVTDARALLDEEGSGPRNLDAKSSGAVRAGEWKFGRFVDVHVHDGSRARLGQFREIEVRGNDEPEGAIKAHVFFFDDDEKGRSD
jgi:hypothetical protein